MRIGIANDLPRLEAHSPQEALDAAAVMLKEWHLENYGTEAGSDNNCYECDVCKIVRKMEKKISNYEVSRTSFLKK